MQIQDAIASRGGISKISGAANVPAHMNPVQWANALRASGVPSATASAAISGSDEAKFARQVGRYNRFKAMDTFGEMGRYGDKEGVLTQSGRLMKLDPASSHDMYDRVLHDPDTAHIGLSDEGAEFHGGQPWRYREESYKYDF
jgi:hypothetical protein